MLAQPQPATACFLQPPQAAPTASQKTAIACRDGAGGNTQPTRWCHWHRRRLTRSAWARRPVDTQAQRILADPIDFLRAERGPQAALVARALALDDGPQETPDQETPISDKASAGDRLKTHSVSRPVYRAHPDGTRALLVQTHAGADYRQAHADSMAESADSYDFVRDDHGVMLPTIYALIGVLGSQLTVLHRALADLQTEFAEI